MKLGAQSITLPTAVKNILLFVMLLAVVMLVNEPTISFNMIYQEQPSIYIANQTITSWQDLLNIYLHPTWLHINIPFFRPSGHYLMYQLLMPALGWHNTKALTIISLVFLALAGFFSIKIYKLLFPSYSVGGFIAFSIYLMHPSLSISRLTIMHFDFAYVFFAMFSLYLFVRFCLLNEKNNIGANQKIQSHYFHLFALSLVLYAIAITFKEPAIMLGPVLFCYYVISHYNKQPLFHYVFEIMSEKKSLFILLTITATSAILSWYLFLSWPSMTYASNSFNLSHSLGTANALLKDIFSLKNDYIPFGTLPYDNYAWRTTIFTPAARYVMWIFFWLSLLGTLFVYRDKKAEAFTYQKSLAFLCLSSLLFTILPLSWASGAPWHHSLTLICYSMVMGFSAEYFFKRLRLRPSMITAYCLLISLTIALIGVTVNFENIIKYTQKNAGFLGISLNRNAILSPPNINHKLNQDSIVVVEDSILHNDYFLGNAAYPFLLFLTNQDYDKLKLREQNFYLQFHHTYNGNLFRYAYLRPKLKEELYPFTIEKMEDIPNEIIYSWLKHYNNIFCLGYDSAANWYDKTEAFKKYLSREQSIRHLGINNYLSTPVNTLPAHITHTRTLPFPDAQLCQYTCDQDKQCKGFIYFHSVANHHYNTQCYFYSAQLSATTQACINCNNYVKAR